MPEEENRMATTRCAQCGSPLVEITLNRGESTMTMQSCSTCDTRSWRADGELLPIHRVLEAVGRR